MLYLFSFIGGIVALALLRFLSLGKTTERLFDYSRKSLKIMTNSKISDHWKERILPYLAIKVLSNTLKLSFIILALIVSYLFTSFLLITLFTPSQSISNLFTINIQLLTLIFLIIIAPFLLKSNNLIEHSSLSKFLHQLALDSHTLRSLLYKIESLFFKQHHQERPVFIAGLARSGTTILLNTLYETKAFTSFTYKNMPYVMSPSLGAKMQSLFLKSAGKKTQRAHGDGILINRESPEAFEEVLWMHWDSENYLSANELNSHFPNSNTYLSVKASIERFAKKRYLSKNNNNIARIPTLYKMFEDAIVIIPFRHPLDHANSLFKQHKRFLKKHEEDAYTKDYMCWIGHFEFGASHKRFNFIERKDSYLPNEYEYWLSLWCDVYHYLLETSPAQANFLCYEKICENPKEQLDKLEIIISKSPLGLSKLADSFHQPKDVPKYNKDLALLTRAQIIYDQLKARSI